MTLTKSTFKPAEDSSFPWTGRVPFNTLLKFPTPKPIKRGGLIRLEEIGWGGEEGGAAKLPLKQSFKVGPCKTCDKYPHQDMSSSLHIWASPKHDADKSSDFCWAIHQTPQWRWSQTSSTSDELTLENLNQCMFLHKHIIQSLPSLEATHTIELLAKVVETLTFKNLNSHATTLIAKCTVLY